MSRNIFDLGEPHKKTQFHRDRKFQWVEDAYLAGDQAGEYLPAHFDTAKLRTILSIVALIFLVILIRLGQLQIVKGREYRLAAEENRLRLHNLKAPRGLIYDRHGVTLVHNIPNFVLSFTPGDLPKDVSAREALTTELAAILAVDPQKLKQIIQEKPPDSYQSFILSEHIPYDQALPLRIATAAFSGVTLETSAFREYLTDQAFSPLLGYLGSVSEADLTAHPDYAYDDYLGKAGVELAEEAALKGKNGKKEIEVDSLGKESKIVAEEKPTAGKNITLTIDSELQETLGRALEKTVNSSRSITGAAAVAIDVQTGEILALASSPTFDSNKLTLGLTMSEFEALRTDPKKPFVNRAVSGEYPSGSTIKPVIALAALQEGVITPKTTVMSTGGIRIDKWFFPDWKAGGHGLTDLRKALAESVNTFFYIAGGGYESTPGLGLNQMTTYLRLFGLGNKLDLDFPNEASGFLPTVEWKEKTKGEQWYIGDTYHLAIGQGDLLVTPLQVATYTATIANGGTFYQPHLVHAYTDSRGTTTEVQPQIVRQDFINDSYYQVVREGLRQGVTAGSSQALADLPVTAAGKTGTAQFGENKTHAWFTSFAPYENPQIALTVLVEAGGEGHLTALPIAKAGLLNWFSRYKP